MPAFDQRTDYVNGREGGAAARLNAAWILDLEDRIATAIGSGIGGGGGTELVYQGTPLVANITLDMTNHQDVLWIMTVAANIKVEIGGWAPTKSVTLVLKQDATGNRGVQLPTAKWSGGVIPPTTQAAGGIDVRSFFRGSQETFGFDSGTAMA